MRWGETIHYAGTKARLTTPTEGHRTISLALNPTDRYRSAMAYTHITDFRQRAPVVRPPSEPREKYRILNPRIAYEGSFQRGVFPFEHPRESHLKDSDADTYDPSHDMPYAFNHLVVRNGVFLATGDLPRLAIGLIPQPRHAQPPMTKLGDLRFQIEWGGQCFWLDEQGSFRVEYHPWGTLHHIETAIDGITLRLELQAALYEDRAMSVILTLRESPLPVGIGGVFGGMAPDAKCGGSEGIHLKPDDGEDDNIARHGPYFLIWSNPHLPHSLLAGGQDLEAHVCPSYPAVAGPRAVFSQTCLKDQAWSFSAWINQAETTPPGKLQHAARTYYARLLQDIVLATPDPVLDAAFHSSVINMDYLYQKPVWLEGIHGWRSSRTNHYQISAAIYLGQQERARLALLAFCKTGHGTGPPPMKAGIAPLADERDGLPYLIIQLYRYWKKTDDHHLLRQVWERCSRSFAQFLLECDPDEDGLFNFHHVGNACLYQADPPRLPAGALSPSIMVCAMLDAMAEMALALDAPESAKAWQQKAGMTRREIQARLWDVEEGRYCACVDPQGRKQIAAYYTDYAFPSLYGNFDPADARPALCLQAMLRDLAVGDALCRVGNLMPPVFGHNAVQPAQMAEAAEALFRAGDAAHAARLLHGAARSATIYTDAPGTFPEYCSNSGYGLGKYLSCQPAGAFIVAVVHGLFGWNPAGGQSTWFPSIPDHWEFATLCLPDVRFSIRGTANYRMFRIESTQPVPLRVRIPLHGKIPAPIEDTAATILTSGVQFQPGGDVLEIRTERASAHEFRIRLVTSEYPYRQTCLPASNGDVTFPLPAGDWTVIDPARILLDWQILNHSFLGRTSPHAGTDTLYLLNRASNRSLEIRIPADTPRTGLDSQ